MNIKELEAAIELVKQFNLCGDERVNSMAAGGNVDQRYVVVRGDRSGVFCGIIASEEGRTVELTECRHIWYWKGAANTASLALAGVSKPAECKFLPPVRRLRVLDVIEVIDCTEVAEKSLRAVPEWIVK